MSHFTVMIIGDNPTEQLKPFDENKDTPRYVKFTKEGLIKKGKEDIENYKNGLYAEYLKDKEAYEKDCGTPHFNYISKEFPEKLKWNDEQIYKDELRWYEPEDIGEDGEVYSTYNPKSKWDWHSLGGRWSGMIKLKEGAIGKEGTSGVYDNETGIDQAYKKDISNFEELNTFAILKDGEWYERGKMGWWAIVSDEKDEDVWDKERIKLLEGLPDDTLISIYDCHI